MSFSYSIPSQSRYSDDAPPHVVSTQCGYASDTDLIGVLGFLPQEGEVGCPVTVRVQFTDHWDHQHKVSVRLVVFDKPVATQVTPDAHGTWTLDATIPYLPSETLSSVQNKVPLSIQVLDSDSQSVLDQLTFGDFTYWTSERPPFQVSMARAMLEKTDALAPVPQVPSSFHPEARRCSVPSLHSSSSIIQRTQVERRCRGRSLIASRPGAAEDDTLSQKIKLEIMTPLQSMCDQWTHSEQQVGRRLVKIRKLQTGSKIVLSCEPFAQQDYVAESEDSARDCIVSCIYYKKTEKYYVTSVDVIYLLQRITNHPSSFPTDEKNRIRRNMEALRPTVVAKTKGSEVLFSLIMNFPDPKPRNIEKDIKVFEWTQLGQALDRVLSKYSLYSINLMSALPVDRDIGGASSSSSSRMDDAPLSLPSQNETGPAAYVDPTVIETMMKSELHESPICGTSLKHSPPTADVILLAPAFNLSQDKKVPTLPFIHHAGCHPPSPTTSESLLNSDGWPASSSYTNPLFRFPHYPGGTNITTNSQVDPVRNGFDSWDSAIH